MPGGKRLFREDFSKIDPARLPLEVLLFKYVATEEDGSMGLTAALDISAGIVHLDVMGWDSRLCRSGSIPGRAVWPSPVRGAGELPLPMHGGGGDSGQRLIHDDGRYMCTDSVLHSHGLQGVAECSLGISHATFKHRGRARNVSTKIYNGYGPALPEASGSF